MTTDLFNPKFVFHSSAADSLLDRDAVLGQIERAIVAWNIENGIDPKGVATRRDATVELLEPCTGGGMRVDLWVEDLDATSCVYGFLCSSEDGLIPYARGEERITKIDPASKRPAAWSSAFRHTQEMLRKDLPAFA